MTDPLTTTSDDELINELRRRFGKSGFVLLFNDPQTMTTVFAAKGEDCVEVRRLCRAAPDYYADAFSDRPQCRVERKIIGGHDYMSDEALFD